MEQKEEYNDNLEAEVNFPIPPKEMLIEASGKNERGLPKTKVGLFYQIMDLEGQILQDKMEVTALDPILSINKNFSKVTVDIVFASKSNVYFAMMNDLMRAAYLPEASIADDGATLPAVTLVMLPEKYEGRYYMLAADPIYWGITAQNPRGDLDTLRLVFEDYDFYFLENDDDTLLAMNADKKNAEAEEERKMEAYEKREAERKARANKM